YTLAQTPPAIAPTPLVSPSPKPSVSPTTSPSPKPSISPITSPSPSPIASPPPTGKKVTAKMVVIGNAMFMTNQWFNEQLNGDLFLNSVQWLASKQEQPLAIRPKEPKNRRINLSSAQASAISWLSLVIFPLLGIGLGVGTWWRRR
ncbi:MAG: ABC transporter, partial [Microcystaceae cyanobacterium]